MRRLHAAALALLLCAVGLAAQTPQRPNLVLIVTDNHGAWSIGPYGNKDVHTPQLDRMAREGAVFTQAFANNAVCSPTRASLLSGLMPSQHGVHRYLGADGLQIGPDAHYALEELATIPSVLVQHGYKAGLVGKWHLGDNLHPQPGFDEWITMPHGHSPGFYDQQVIENGSIRKEPRNLTDLWTERAVDYIAKHKAEPFFLYLAYNGPYGLGGAMEEAKRNKHFAEYADSPMASMPQDAPHPWNFNYGKWMRDLDVRRKYASEITAIDDGVGAVLDALERHGLDDNTLVIFIGDQGLAGGHSGFWGMGDHTRPLTAFDWTMWIPLLVRQPGRIAGGLRSDHIVTNYDVLPTVLDWMGMQADAPQSPVSPGRSFAPLLRGESTAWDDVVFFEFENVRAIRTPEWKYIERFAEGPAELYDLTNDAGERLNLAADMRFSGERAALAEGLHAFFDQYADPKWDLWKGGRSKSGLITENLFGADAAGEKPRR
ncbi:MAG: sulfatase-like hydrolase/transferase [Acidobacteria bacterium]|nr:sulfatase-like hydrolase/transferase [Acidobacteriota bacterium]